MKTTAQILAEKPGTPVDWTDDADRAQAAESKRHNARLRVVEYARDCLDRATDLYFKADRDENVIVATNLRLRAEHDVDAAVEMLRGGADAK